MKKKIKINFFRNTDKSSDNRTDKAQLPSLNVDEHTLFNVIFLTSYEHINEYHITEYCDFSLSVCFSKYPTLKTRNSTKTMYALINIIFATQIFFFYFFHNVAYLVDEFSILPRTVKSLADICSSSLPFMRNKMQYPISNMYTLRNTVQWRR